MPSAGHSRGRVHVTANLLPLGKIVFTWWPHVPLSSAPAELDEIMFNNAKIWSMYDFGAFPRHNQQRIEVNSPAAFEAVVNAEPVSMFRGRGQQTVESASQPDADIQPAGCIAPVLYQVPPAQRAAYQARTDCGPASGCWDGYDWDTHTYVPSSNSKEMFDSLPTAKVGTQKSVSFCVNADCTPQ
jgi:hypothetical protein